MSERGHLQCLRVSLSQLSGAPHEVNKEKQSLRGCDSYSDAVKA